MEHYKINFFIVLFLFSTFCYSQKLSKIYLFDNNVVEGEIKEVTAKEVKIHLRDSDSLSIINRDEVRLIIYSDNTVVIMNEEKSQKPDNTKVKIQPESDKNHKIKSNQSKKSERKIKSYLPTSLQNDTIIKLNDVSEIPKFKGCEKRTKEKELKCMQAKIEKHILKHYDKKIAKLLVTKMDSDIFRTGKKNTHYLSYAFFVIDKNGNVYFNFHSGHKTQVEETKRVIDLLPKMSPGKLNGELVNVSWTIDMADIVVKESWLY